MSCCCNKTRDRRTRDPSEYNGLAASNPSEAGIESRPHRFLIPTGCVLDEQSGIWTRLVVSPGYDSTIVNAAGINYAVTESSAIRLETYSQINEEHNEKQKYIEHFLRSCTAYDYVYQGWYNQKAQKWQLVVKTVGGPIALLSITLSGVLTETVLLTFYADDGDILSYVDEYETKSYIVRVRSDFLNDEAVLLHVDAVFTGEEIDLLNPATAPNSIIQDCFVYITAGGTVSYWRMATLSSWIGPGEVDNWLSNNALSTTVVPGPLTFSFGRTWIDSTDGEYIFGAIEIGYTVGDDPVYDQFAAAWDLSGNLTVCNTPHLIPSGGADGFDVIGTGQYGTALGRTNSGGTVYGTMLCLEAGKAVFFYHRPSDDLLTEVTKYAEWDPTSGITELGDHDVDATPNIFPRFQPSWGKTSTGLVSVGIGDIYRYCSDAGLCTDFTNSDWHHYTVANDRVWGTTIKDDPSYTGFSILVLEMSDTGGDGGIDPGNGQTVLLHDVYRGKLELGDTFTDANGAYALSTEGDSVRCVHFTNLISTYFIHKTCKGQCVIECSDDGGRNWYTTCKTSCICRPEDSPGACSESNIGRLAVHTCGSKTSECSEEGVCRYRVIDPTKDPGELLGNIVNATAILIQACECNCPCPAVVLAAAYAAGGLRNGDIIYGRCFYDPYFDSSCLPEPHDCLAMGGSMQLQVQLELACHSSTPTLTLTKTVDGHYELANYEVPGTDGCLFIDVEFDCAEGYGEVALVVRNADGLCSAIYQRYASHVVSNVYQVTIEDPANMCCCACSESGLFDFSDPPTAYTLTWTIGLNTTIHGHFIENAYFGFIADLSVYAWHAGDEIKVVYYIGSNDEVVIYEGGDTDDACGSDGQINQGAFALIKVSGVSGSGTSYLEITT